MTLAQFILVQLEENIQVLQATVKQLHLLLDPPTEEKDRELHGKAKGV